MLSFVHFCSCHDISDLETIIEKYQSFEIGLNLYDSYESDDSILLTCVPEVGYNKAVMHFCHSLPSYVAQLPLTKASV